MYRCLDGSPFVHRLMPLCRTKGRDILIAVECALQRQIVRKRGFLFSRYERICFVVRKEENMGIFSLVVLMKIFIFLVKRFF